MEKYDRDKRLEEANENVAKASKLSPVNKIQLTIMILNGLLTGIAIGRGSSKLIILIMLSLTWFSLFLMVDSMQCKLGVAYCKGALSILENIVEDKEQSK